MRFRNHYFALCLAATQMVPTGALSFTTGDDVSDQTISLGSCNARKYVSVSSQVGFVVLYGTETQLAGGAYFETGGVISTYYNPVSEDVIASCLGTTADKITGLTQDGADGTFESDTYIGFTFTLTEAAGGMDAGTFTLSTEGNPPDSTAPVLTPPTDQTASTDSGKATAALDVTSLGSGTDDTDSSVTITYKVGTTTLTGAYDFPVGQTTVTMDASDAAGNEADQVSFTVTVTDGEAPVLTAPDDQSQTAASGQSSASIDVTGLGSVADNVDGSVAIIYKVGTTTLTGAYDFPLGATTVTMDASDAAGNEADQVSFTVTVGDGTAPVLTAPDDQRLTTAAGETTASLDVTSLGSGSDDTDSSVSITYKVGTTTLTGAHDFPIGQTTVTMDAIDSAGNAATQVSFTVTVADGTPPPAPTISSVVVNGDQTVTVTGTAQIGSTVTVTFPDGSQVQTSPTVGVSARTLKAAAPGPESTVLSAGTGPYSATSATPQTSGNIIVSSANGSGASSANVTATVDTTAPDVVLSGGPAGGVAVNETFSITVTFSEDVTGFTAADVSASNATVVGVSGTGASYQAQLRASGVGTVSVQVPAGAAEDGAGNQTRVSNTLVIANTTVTETQKQIAGFLYGRANQLIANQPGLIGFLSGADGAGSARAHVTRGAGDFDLASRAGQPVWFRLQGRWSKTDSSDSQYSFGAVGTHFRVSETVLIGAMLQFDHLSQDSGASAVSGTGWMAGPYVVAQLPGEALFLEGRLLYGETSNSISPFGTYEDDFDTTRLLAQLRLAGELRQGDTRVMPYLDVAYANEDQKAYTDSLGNAIGAQKIHLRQASFGVDMSHQMPATDGGSMLLTGGLAGVWSSTSGTAVAQTVIPAYAGWRGKLDLGLRYTWAYGGALDLSAMYDGLGVSGYEDYGLRLSYSHRF